MTRYGFVSGANPDQIFFQQDVLAESEMLPEGNIVSDVPWIDFYSMLEPGDEIVVVAESRLGPTPDERQARKEMLDLAGITLITLTRDFEKG